MEKIKLQVSSSQIHVVERPGALTAGMVGLEVEFSFDSHWDNLGKTVIFRAGDKVIAAALEGNTHIIPWEVLERPEVWLVIGIYGANADGTVVIPTLWTKVAAVYNGAEPEGDPALEPSNPIWQQTLARVADMEPQVQEHINSTDNPHAVSCDQIGAVTRKEFWDMVSNLDDSSNPEGVIFHLLNQENPHGVTAEQASAAPAGYGLGKKYSPGVNWNHGYENSFVRGNTNSPDRTIWYGLTCVNGSSDACSTHIAFSQNSGNSVCEVRRSRNSAGTWGEWEYVNPPMAEGVEYRTTERFNGKPVYAKLISVGYLPASRLSKWVMVSEERVDVIDIKSFMTRDDNAGYFPIPNNYNNNDNISAYIAYAAYIAVDGTTATWINLIPTKDMSAYAAYTTVKYTKNETT